MRDGFYSMVGAQNIPAYTGLTIGEFARYVNGQMTTPCDLHVVEMQNWRREMEYPDTGLPGVVFHPVTFTPMFSKHQGALCNGIFTYVTDKKAYRSAETGLHLLHQIMNLHTEFDWVMPLEAERKGKWFIDLLSGSDMLRTTVHDPAGLADIVAGWQADCEQWQKIRASYLLYEGASSYV